MALISQAGRVRARPASGGRVHPPYGTSRGRCYNRAECSSLRGDGVAGTVAQFAERGYTPCSNCIGDAAGLPPPKLGGGVADAPSPNPEQELSQAELSKIQGEGSIDGYGFFSSALYNGGGFALKSIRVKITVKNADGRVAIDEREYELRTRGYGGFRPLTSETVTESVGFKLQPGQTWSWHISGAKGVSVERPVVSAFAVRIKRTATQP